MKLLTFTLIFLLSATAYAENSANTSSGDRFKRLEDEHQKEMFEKMEERQTVKQDLKKDSSPECRFWRLQQKTKPSAKATQKIREFCSHKAQVGVVQVKK